MLTTALKPCGANANFTNLSNLFIRLISVIRIKKMDADAIVFIVLIVFLLSVERSERKRNQGTRLHRRPPGISNCGYEKLL